MIVDDCDDFILKRCETMSTNSNSIRVHNGYMNKSQLYELDNLTKYATALNAKDKSLYVFNPHFG